MSYESLLENYVDESAVVSFAEMNTMLESLSDFVNEEVNFTVEISIQEAEEGEVKDKENKVGAALSSGVKKLIEKLQNFITKIGNAIRQFVAKASIVIKQGGNKALAKMVASNSGVLKKDVTLVSIDTGKVKGVISAASLAANQISQNINNKNAVPETVQTAIKELGEKLEKSDVVAQAKADVNETIKKQYEKHVKVYLDLVDELIKGEKSVVGICKKSQANAKDIIKDLKSQKEKDSASISVLSNLSSAAMQLATRVLIFGNSVLTIATKNSAKLALAAADRAASNKKQQVKNRVDETKAKADQKIKNVKADMAAKKEEKAAAKEAKKNEKK